MLCPFLFYRRLFGEIYHESAFVEEIPNKTLDTKFKHFAAR